MNYTPVARIAVRYIVGLILGAESASLLAGDPDLIAAVALLIGAGVEVAYAYAKKHGLAT